tara:strand:- start:485 stop:913 length:429 start_codon:yes stop_codon:yes gene_type:complete
MASHAKRKDQLHHILNDDGYWKNDNGFKSFLQDQYDNLKKGYTLSEKQEAAVTKAVKRYATYFFMNNDPKFKQKVDDKIARIKMVKQMLSKCNYHESYVWRSEDFLNSVENQVKKFGKLSEKQVKALNSMYKRFKKKSENNA